MSAGLIQRGVVRIALMAIRNSAPTRRELMAGLGVSAASLIMGGAAAAEPSRLDLRAQPATLSLRPGAATPVWELAAATSGETVRLGKGARYEARLRNDLPVPIAPVWRGLDGNAAAAPLLGRPQVAANREENPVISIPHAGTLMADLRLLEDGVKQPARPLPVIVEEAEPVAVDRDELFLVEDWRLTPDGMPLLPGSADSGISPVYTVNGKLVPDFTLRPNERLRLRLINGCQRTVIAVKIENIEVTVMALDSQPAEPFAARNGAVVLAPGSRADVVLDGTMPPGSSAAIRLHDGKEARPVGRLLTSAQTPLRASRLPPPAPLPSNGLPAELDLRGALRFDVALGAVAGGWIGPAGFSASTAPTFRARVGRTAVLALTNRGSAANVVHLHGHHVRLLDRLDDGWKPYWLDTLAVEPGQTQRVAFAPTSPGRWLIESVATDWTAPRLVRWYAVE